MMFLARTTDLERLFSARSICYLVGDSEGGDQHGNVSLLLGALDVLGRFADTMLSVPLIDYRCREGFDDLCRSKRDLFGHACFLYFDLSDKVVESDQMAGVPNPPSVYSQILICGWGAISKRSAETKLDLIHNLHRWITFDGKVEEERFPPIVVSAQQVGRQVLTDPENNRLVDLFKTAALLGVSDYDSYESIRALGEPDISSKLYLSTDDSLHHMIGAAYLMKNCLQEVDRRHESIAQDLLESMERLSALQRDYTALLDASSHLRSNLGGEIADLRGELRYYEQMRFQLVDRLFGALGERRVLHPLLRLLHRVLGKVVRH
jgi:hypothetical protein